eukprot:CAMPEP_0116022904 /NCGR_PEP_ID=MMETSP0321-20121206/11258_1 /TAXON_ID=163516 /ORGANISM="Leptocylindrus danicus var. danicus, Strain B650" /LENGTH=236 /DNA_ID=CAMNT_0003494051 /DNA_START=32 /DNA_END=740 /DNA_ORIENTATION=-
MPPSTSVHVFLKSITIFLLQQSALPFVLQKQPVHEINPNKQQWRKAISAQEQHRLRASSTCTSDDDTDSYSSSIFAPISSILHNNNNDKVTDPKMDVNFGTSYDSHTARLEGRWLRTFEDVQTKQGVLSYLQTVHGSWTLQDAELFYRRSRNEELVIDRVYNGDSGEVVLGEFQFSDDDDDDDDDDDVEVCNLDQNNFVSRWKSVDGKRVHITTRGVPFAHVRRAVTLFYLMSGSR